ncbi:hypothetical protein LWI28_027236 [Acer negundo]|uniref:D-isomer specific 2-hydroxyacid dehydrogenase NAD-binding domain-containing protein n=1 Tax=Acer negundo TaxID=4023 RepID=A0AAD5NJX7_ACENE|nr:hypothetical protein LWI28_027236 [Acer negundo]
MPTLSYVQAMPAYICMPRNITTWVHLSGIPCPQSLSGGFLLLMALLGLGNGKMETFDWLLSGKSVGIAGLGRIGSAIAKIAEAFHLATNCQILVVACALTQETHHIVNRKVIDALGPNGILINIGRGAHVDEPELVSALLEGRLAGAGLDVYENEPEVPEQLLGLDNVVLLPHVGRDTGETSKAMADLVIRNLEAYFGNKPLLTPAL